MDVRNTPVVPIVALVAAALLTAAAALTRTTGQSALSEREIGLAAWALTLAVFGLQGASCVLLEGQELRLGSSPPRVTARLSLAIAGSSALLVGIALLVGVAILSGRSTAVVGATAGAGCLCLAVILGLCKEGLAGREAHVDARDDGVPW
jgi:hypothetical protein